MANVLALPPVAILGHLHALWHAVLEQQEDGDLSSWPDDMIAHAAAYTGDAAAFVRALQEQKFLDGKVVHDWLDYAGRYLKNKYRTSNPKKLKAIYKLHQSVSRSDSRLTTVRLKSDNQPNQPDLTRPDPPNQTNQSKKKNSREGHDLDGRQRGNLEGVCGSVSEAVWGRARQEQIGQFHALQIGREARRRGSARGRRLLRHASGPVLCRKDAPGQPALGRCGEGRD